MLLLIERKRFINKAKMKIYIYYSPMQRKLECITIDVLAGTLLGEALPERLAKQVASQAVSCAVWGKAVKLTYKLKAGDRVELLRNLRVDPMTARRERFAKQGVKKAGLFKTKRQGAKAGY
jgi:putative ubiquitin-RnfH superfamily antitoxin RatB of RatAB toxin-antitoxin module